MSYLLHHARYVRTLPCKITKRRFLPHKRWSVLCKSNKNTDMKCSREAYKSADDVQNAASTHRLTAVVKVVMWSGGGLTWRSQVGANLLPHPTNLALCGHKITLYRFNQGAHTIAGGLKFEQAGAAPPPPFWPLANRRRGHVFLLWPCSSGASSLVTSNFAR